MDRIILAAALALASSAAGADTLVIVHPDAIETLTGSFNDGLVSAPTFGQINNFVSTERVITEADGIGGSGFEGLVVPWTITIDDEPSVTYTCASFLRYFAGYPTLTLTCGE
jgi:hypothetical protein